MVKENKKSIYITNLIDKTINLTALWVSIISSIIAYFFTVDFGNLLIFAYVLFMIYKQKPHSSILLNILIFYTLGLFSVHYYDVDKLSEIFVLSILPIIFIGLFIKYSKVKLSWIYIVSTYSHNLLKKIISFTSLKVKIPKFSWLILSFIIGYLITYYIRDTYYIYGGIILTLLLSHLVFNTIAKDKVKMISTVMMTIYVLLFNLTLNRGLLVLLSSPLEYLYVYLPTILIPYFVLVSYLIMISGSNEKSQEIIEAEEENISESVESEVVVTEDN